MDAVDYVEEEYFLSGQAHVYDWAGATHDVRVVAGPTPYVTRLLVRRPRDAARFSGNVEVTIMNASSVEFGKPTDMNLMVQQGDVWIGITSKSNTVKGLKQFDPARYQALNWDSPVPIEKRCAQPSIIPVYMIGEQAFKMAAAAGVSLGSSPETEDGLIWDMLGQLGLLLKSEQRDKILPGFGKVWSYMAGVSQSSIYMRTWMAGFAHFYRTSDGRASLRWLFWHCGACDGAHQSVRCRCAACRSAAKTSYAGSAVYLHFV